MKELTLSLFLLFAFVLFVAIVRALFGLFRAGERRSTIQPQHAFELLIGAGTVLITFETARGAGALGDRTTNAENTLVVVAGLGLIIIGMIIDSRRKQRR